MPRAKRTKPTPPAVKTPEAETPEAETPEAETPEAETPEAETVDYHRMAPGRAVTTKRGIVGPGGRIDVGDLAGGKTAFDAFVKAGKILPPGVK